MSKVDAHRLLEAIPITIAAAVPRLAPRDLPIEARTLVYDLVRSVAFAKQTERLGELVAACEQTPFIDSLPGLAAIADRSLEPNDLPTRIANRLDALKWRTWADVASASPASIRGTWSIGGQTLAQLATVAVRKTLTAIADLAVDAAAAEGMVSHELANEDLLSERPSLPNATVRASIVLLARWATATNDGRTLADVLIGNVDDLPRDVAEAVTRLRDVRLCELVTPPPPDADVGRVGRLLETLDEAGRAVVRGRSPVAGRETLDEIARRRGITRERIRQIGEMSRAKLLSSLDREEHADVRWDLHHVRRSLGIGIFCDAGDPLAAAAKSLPSDAGRWTPGEVDVMLWLAGPYRLDDGRWLRRDALPEASEVARFVAGEGRVDVSAARAFLIARGLSASGAADAWLTQFLPTRVVSGQDLLWTGSIADKLARVLSVYDEPADAAGLLAIAGEQHSVRTTQNALLSDPRFVRADRQRFGLRAWGLDEYAGLAKAIAEELAQRGPAGGRLDDVIAIVATRFSARITSVRAYASAPMFVTEGERIRLRRQGELFEIAADVEGHEEITVRGTNGLAIRLNIDADTLRGSGRSTRPSVAAWAGVTPDGSATFASDFGEMRITWPTTCPKPSMGSIRAALAAIGAVSGDVVTLLLDRAERQWRVVHGSETN